MRTWETRGAARTAAKKAVIILLAALMICHCPAAAETPSKEGDRGRREIPELGISVALFEVPSTSDEAKVSQAICNAQDSAAWMDFSDYYGTKCQPFIGDHKNQGFDGLYDAVPGETLATIRYDGEEETYRCTAKLKGTNTSVDIIDENGHNAAFENIDGVCMYTCNDNWKDLTVTYWERLSASEEGEQGREADKEDSFLCSWTVLGDGTIVRNEEMY